MRNIILGTFYKSKKLAYKKAKEKGWGKFVVLEGSNGYLVVAKRQVKNLICG